MRPTKAYLKALEEHTSLLPEYLEARDRYIQAGKVTLWAPSSIYLPLNRLGSRLSALEHRLVIESQGKWKKDYQ